MKTKRFLVFGLPVLLLALGLAVCDTGGGPADGPNNTIKEFLLSGYFTDEDGKKIYFTLDNKEKEDDKELKIAGSRFWAAAGVDDGYGLTGVLESEDQAVALRLRGSYDPASGNWSVSARPESGGDEAMVFSIDGGVNSAGDFVGGATILRPNPDASDGDNEWLAAFAPAEEETLPSSFVGVGTPIRSGIPEAMRGSWSASWTKDIPDTDGETLDMTMRCIISDWKIKVVGREFSPWEDRVIYQNQNIVLIEEVTEGDYAGAIDVTSCYPVYMEDAQNLRAALTEWLGLPEDSITLLAHLGEEKPNGPWMVNAPMAPYPVRGGFTDRQWEEMQSFYAAGGWEAYAAAHNITPSIKFSRYRFQLDGDNLNMTKMVADSGSPLFPQEAFASLADLEAAETDENYPLHMEERYVDTGDGEPVSVGVLTVPFTR